MVSIMYPKMMTQNHSADLIDFTKSKTRSRKCRRKVPDDEMIDMTKQLKTRHLDMS